MFLGEIMVRIQFSDSQFSNFVGLIIFGILGWTVFCVLRFLMFLGGVTLVYSDRLIRLHPTVHLISLKFVVSIGTRTSLLMQDISFWIPSLVDYYKQPWIFCQRRNAETRKDFYLFKNVWCFWMLLDFSGRNELWWTSPAMPVWLFVLYCHWLNKSASRWTH